MDAYTEDEQLTVFYTMLEEHLALPFTTTALGVEVAVKKLDLTDAGIVATCMRGQSRQAIGVLDLPLPSPRPDGAEWIDAYRRWAVGR